MKRVLLATAAIAMLALGAAPASAQTTASVVIHTTVTDAVQLGCSGTTSTWEVEADVEVTNPTSTQKVATFTDFDVQYSTPTESETFQPNVAVYSSGGFTAGLTLAPGETRTFHARIRADIPCEATNAEFIAEMKVDGDRRNYLAGDFFLEDGTPVPSGAIGVVGVAGLAGVGLWFANRRKSSPSPEADHATVA